MNSTKRKIALVSGNYLDIGGVEQHILQIIHRLSNIFTFVIIASTSQSFQRRCLAINHEIAIYEWAPCIAWDLKAARLLRRILLTNQIDLVHTHDPRGGLLGRLVATQCHLPRVHTIHMPAHFIDNNIKSSLYAFVEKLVNNYMTDKVIYVSASIHKHALRYGHTHPKKSIVIPNGIDLEDFRFRQLSPFNLELPCLQRKSTKIVFIGRLTKQKGVDLLINALSQLKNENNDLFIDVWIVGDGPERTYLQQLTLEKNLSDIVHFLGFREDIGVILKSSDFFVLPSRYEGLPYAILEAMASSLPVVATDVGENKAIVDEAGLIIPPNNVIALKDAILTMTKNIELRNQYINTTNKYIQRYSDKNMCTEIANVYQQCLSKKIVRI